VIARTLPGVYNQKYLYVLLFQKMIRINGQNVDNFEGYQHLELIITRKEPAAANLLSKIFGRIKF